jgi:hypothetical protein
LSYEGKFDEASGLKINFRVRWKQLKSFVEIFNLSHIQKWGFGVIKVNISCKVISQKLLPSSTKTSRKSLSPTWNPLQNLFNVSNLHSNTLDYVGSILHRSRIIFTAIAQHRMYFRCQSNPSHSLLQPPFFVSIQLWRALWLKPIEECMNVTFRTSEAERDDFHRLLWD